MRSHIIALSFALLLLIACQGRSPVTGAVVFAVQCSDGTFADLPSDCPQPEQAQVSIQDEPAPLPVIETAPVVETPAPEAQAPVLVPVKKLAQALIEKAPETYVYSDGAHTVYASGTLRSTGEWPFAAPGLIYWDTNSDVLNVWVGDISAHWWDIYKNQKTRNTKSLGTLGATLYPAGIIPIKLTGNKKQDAALIPKEFLKYFQQQFYRAGGLKEDSLIKLILPYYVQSPIETLRKYANEDPVSVDTSDNTIVLPSGRLFSTLALTFASKEKTEALLVKDGETSYWSTPVQADYIIFRFDSHGIPVVIDKFNNDGKMLERKTYTISTTYERQGVENTPVTPRIVDLPPHIIITTEDFDAWRSDVQDLR